MDLENDDPNINFYRACEVGDIEVVKILLNEKRVEVNQEGCNSGVTSFYIACFNGESPFAMSFLTSR